ncbi:hypothetical protein ACO0RG_003002 [Hanseniaspora osmophila]
MALEDYEDIDEMEMSLSDIAPRVDTPSNTKLDDKYILIYPCYFDKNRTIKQGRRLKKELCIDNPLGMIVAATCHMLQYDMKYEFDKTHPQDFLNPGRIKIKKYTKSGIKKDKNQILMEISKNMPRSTQVVVKSLTTSDIVEIDSSVINKQYPGIKNNKISFLPRNSPLSEMTSSKVKMLQASYEEIVKKQEVEQKTSKTLQKKIKKGNKIKMIRR